MATSFGVCGATAIITNPASPSDGRASPADAAVRRAVAGSNCIKPVAPALERASVRNQFTRNTLGGRVTCLPMSSQWWK